MKILMHFIFYVINISAICAEYTTNNRLYPLLSYNTKPCYLVYTANKIALATDYTWNGSVSSNWTIANNWTPNGTPLSTDNVLIDIAINAPVLSSTVTINNLTINGTGNLSVNSGGNLTINGSFNFDNSNGASVNFNASSIINFASSGAITIPALSYGTLNRTANGSTIISNSGVLSIKTSFSPGNASYIITGSTIDFASSGSQSIPAFSYNNLTNSGNGTRNLPSGTINVAGTYAPTSGNINVNTNTFNFSSTTSQIIPAAKDYNITNTGNGPRVFSSTGIIKINGDSFTPSSSTNTTTGSTIELANSSTMTMSSFPYNNLIFSGSSIISLAQGIDINIAGNLNITGNGIIKIGTSGGSNNLTVQGDLNMESSCSFCKIHLITASSCTGATLTVKGNMYLDGGSSAQLGLKPNTASGGAGVVNILGSLSVSSTNSNTGIINFGEGSSNVGNKIVLYGNLTKSGNGVFTTSGSGPSDGFVFNKTGEQSFTYSGATSAHMRWQVNSGSSLKLLSNLTFDLVNVVPLTSLNIMNGGTLDMGIYAITGGNASTVNINAGATLKTANDVGINSTGSIGSIQNVGTRYFDSGANYEFQGSNTGVFTTSPIANTIKNLVLNNSGNITTLSQNLTLTGTLVFINGSLKLNNNNLLFNSGAVSGYNSNKYIITNGSGTLKINSINASPQLFPIGPSEFYYNPFSFANTGGSLNVTASVYENITNSSNIDPNKIVNVEWNITPSASANASIVFNWNIGQQGNEFNPSIAKLYHYDPPWSVISNSSVGSNSATANSVTNFSPFLVGNQQFYLPIELNNFWGESKEGNNILHFITLSEKNADSIIIERAENQQSTFKEIGMIKAMGNTQAETNYRFVDEMPLLVCYYKLKLLDLDKNYSYSKIIVLSNKENNQEIILYPNPANELLNIDFNSSYEENISINILDPIGRTIDSSTY
ncbi:MAG TPA: hypothetical protein VK590_10845, partial [Saprospiraceae bacterium]|nr:hypothetical protein [Saprospiraceae bacterium]